MKEYRIECVMGGSKKSLHGYGDWKEVMGIIRFLVKEKHARILKVIR